MLCCSISYRSGCYVYISVTTTSKPTKNKLYCLCRCYPFAGLRLCSEISLPFQHHLKNHEAAAAAAAANTQQSSNNKDQLTINQQMSLFKIANTIALTLLFFLFCLQKQQPLTLKPGGEQLQKTLKGKEKRPPSPQDVMGVSYIDYNTVNDKIIIPRKRKQELGWVAARPCSNWNSASFWVTSSLFYVLTTSVQLSGEMAMERPFTPKLATFKGAILLPIIDIPEDAGWEQPAGALLCSSHVWRVKKKKTRRWSWSSERGINMEFGLVAKIKYIFSKRYYYIIVKWNITNVSPD